MGTPDSIRTLNLFKLVIPLVLCTAINTVGQKCLVEFLKLLKALMSESGNVIFSERTHLTQRTVQNCTGLILLVQRDTYSPSI